MIDWYLKVINLLREIRKKSLDASSSLENGDEASAKMINGYLKTDYSNLHNMWIEHFEAKELGYIGRHIGFGCSNDYSDILDRDIPKIEEYAEKHLSENQGQHKEIGFESLLHPVIFEHAYQLYHTGHLRDAVLNAFVAVFDLIRERTSIDLDGSKLASQVFSLNNPQLILSEIESDSGKNDQAGFLQIFQGAYTGIRNPKAHSLIHDLTEEKAAQYLIFASLLARRVTDASQP